MSSEIMFGGIDHDKINGTITWAPVISDDETWDVVVDKFTIVKECFIILRTAKK